MALDGEPLVTEPCHQPQPHVGDMMRAEARPVRPLREPVARQGGRHDVERVGRVRAVAAGVGEQGDDLLHVETGAGPAMGDHQRVGVGAGSWLVDEVNSDAV